jgi:hypothetical protein
MPENVLFVATKWTEGLWYSSCGHRGRRGMSVEPEGGDIREFREEVKVGKDGV